MPSCDENSYIPTLISTLILIAASAATLHDAVQESMRLKPAVASGTMRVTLRDMVLGAGKYTVPAGTALWTPNYPIHNSKYNWGEDAQDYRPVSRLARTAL